MSAIFTGQDSPVPTRPELAALDVLLDLGESRVSGVVAVAAELFAAVVLDLGEEFAADVAELSTRRSGAVSAAVRRADTRTTRRAEHAALRRFAGGLTASALVTGIGRAA